MFILCRCPTTKGDIQELVDVIIAVRKPIIGKNNKGVNTICSVRDRQLYPGKQTDAVLARAFAECLEFIDAEGTACGS